MKFVIFLEGDSKQPCIGIESGTDWISIYLGRDSYWAGSDSVGWLDSIAITESLARFLIKDKHCDNKVFHEAKKYLL